MQITTDVVAAVRSAVRTDRLLDTARELIRVPSPTGSAAAVAQRLADILLQEGFSVERPAAGWAESPAVVARWSAGSAGRVLQFSGHLDTVHLPFVPPRVEAGVLYGSGASDMKGGIAAMLEAMRAIREVGLLTCGGLLLTAYDLHEAPWGDGRQRTALIDEGYVGDGVLLPEYVADRLPIIGRGMGVWQAQITRSGQPVHEVLGGIEQPSVIAAGADLIARLEKLDQQLARHTHPLGGRDSVFIGQVQAGEIYNQSPTTLTLAGTRRWLPGTESPEVEAQWRSILDEVAAARGVQIEGQFQVPGDAFELATDDPLVRAFQAAYSAIQGQPLPWGAKPFVDDGNTFIRRGHIPALTHGPAAHGAHTVSETVPVAELERVAIVYALTALGFCAH